MSSVASGSKRQLESKISHGRTSETRPRCRIPQRLPKPNHNRSNVNLHNDPLTTRHEVSPDCLRASCRTFRRQEPANTIAPTKPSALPTFSKQPQSTNPKRKREWNAIGSKTQQKKLAQKRLPVKNHNRNVILVNFTKKSRSRHGHMGLPDQDSIQRSEEQEVNGDLSDLCVNDVDVNESVTSPRGRMVRMKISWQEKVDRFQALKKELSDRQRDILELYSSLHEIHCFMTENGQKTEMPSAEELKVMNVANMSPDELLALCTESHMTGDRADSPVLNEPLKLDRFYSISSKLIETCKYSLAKRKEIVEWMNGLKSVEGIAYKSLVEKIQIFNSENDELQTYIEKHKTEFQTEVKDIVMRTRKLLKDLITHQLHTEHMTYKYSELTGENMNLRNKLYSLEHTRTNRNRLEDLEKELKEEKCKRMVMRDRLTKAENKLKSSKTAMDDLKTHTWALEQAVQELTEQNHQLQIDCDKDLNELSDSINENKAKLEEIAVAREKLQVENEELEQRLQAVTSANSEEIRNLKNDLKVNVDKLSDMEMKHDILVKEKKELEDKCASLHVQLSKKEQAFEEIVKKVKEHEEEIRKGKDIQEQFNETKHDLEIANKEIEQLKEVNNRQAEKIRDLKNSLRDTMKLEDDMKHAIIEKDVYIDELEKEKICSKEQIRENEIKMCSYEKQLSNIRNHIMELQKDYGDFEDLGELKDMIHRQREQLLEATRHNGELAEELQKRDMEIEDIQFSLKQHERALDEKEQINKMLATKEEDQAKLLEILKSNIEMRDHATNNLSQQLEQKNAEIETILNNLEARKEQICQLEKIVLTLEDQKQIAEQQVRRHQETIKTLEQKLAKYEVENSNANPGKNLDNLMQILEKELDATYNEGNKRTKSPYPPKKKNKENVKRSDFDGPRQTVDHKSSTAKVMLGNVLKRAAENQLNNAGQIGQKKSPKLIPLRGAGIAAYEGALLDKTGTDTFVPQNLPFIVPMQHQKQSRMFKIATHRL